CKVWYKPVLQPRACSLLMILNLRGFSTARISSIIVLAAIGIIFLGGASWNHAPVLDRSASGRPLLIPQGPMGVASATTRDPYWFQEGAIGDSSIQKSVGASVMIRTVYDNVNNDANSYWVVSIIAKGPFV